MAVVLDLERDGVRLKPYDGTKKGEWFPWKGKFEAVIDNPNCGDLLEWILLDEPRPEVPSPQQGQEPDAAAVAAQRAWDKKSRQLHSKLITYTTGEAMAHVQQASTTRDGMAAWKALKYKYELMGSVQKSTLQKELMQTVFKANEDPDVYFHKIDATRRQLNEAGVAFSDELMHGVVMAQMPLQYDTLKAIVDKDGTTDYGVLKKDIRAYYDRHQQSMKAAETDTSMMGEHRTKKCRGCGSKLHLVHDCPRRKKGTRPQPPTTKQPQTGQGKTGDGKGKKAIGPCWACGEMGHLQRDCGGPTKSDPETHVTLCTIAGMEAEVVSDQVWTLDSAATRHMAKSSDGMVTFKPQESGIIVANGDRMVSSGVGDIQARVMTSMEEVSGHVITISDVLCVPGLHRNLMSVKQIANKGGVVTFTPEGGMVKIGGLEIPFRKSGDLYVVNLKPIVESLHHAAPTASDLTTMSDLWHRRLVHSNGNVMSKLGDLDVGVPKGLRPTDPCDTCRVSKHVHRSFPKHVDFRAERPFQLIHSDLEGPLEVASLGKARFILHVIDDLTRYCFHYSMATKDETCRKLKQCLDAMAAITHGWAVEQLRSDNGTEFTKEDVQELCRERGIQFAPSGPHSPQQNGVAERGWRTTLNKVRCLLEQSGLPKELWAEAANTVVYISNRIPSTVLGADTPYHALHGVHADLSHLRVFGCQAFVQVEERDRKKLDEKAWRGIMVGYHPTNRTCYRIFDPVRNKVYMRVHVSFNERELPTRPMITITDESLIFHQPAVQLPPLVIQGEPPTTSAGGGGSGASHVPAGAVGATDGEKLEEQHGEEHGEEHGGDHEGQHEAQGQGSVGAPPEAAPPVGEHEDPSHTESRYGRRLVSTMCNDPLCPARQACGGPHQHKEAYLTFTQSDIGDTYALSASARICLDPKSYEEAMPSPQAQQWKESMLKEYEAHQHFGTWIECKTPPPPGTKILNVKWVYKTKLDANGDVTCYKSRLVCDGSRQRPGVDFDDNYAPVASHTSIRTILSLAAVHDLELHGMDVRTAFLQALVGKAKIYIREPRGVAHKSPIGVCRLVKSMYGIRQASRNWYQTVDENLKEYGLEPIAADPCVYLKTEEGVGYLIALLYVDDFILASNSLPMIMEFKSAISSRFMMKDMGELHWVLGMEIVRDRKKRTLTIKQTGYIDHILERYGMEACKPAATPCEGILRRLSPEEQAPYDREYLSAVGSILYLAIGTRPDLAFAVQNVSRHMNATGQQHWEAVKRIMRYLQGTKDLGITYGIKSEEQLQGYVGNTSILLGFCDSDFAGDADTRRSTTAYVFMVHGGVVSWASRLQPTVALSSVEAEYMCACAAAQEAVYLRRLLGNLGFGQKEATTIYADNQGSIALSENPMVQKRSKHIDTRYHYIRHCVQQGVVKLVYVPSERQLADLLTKSLPRDRVVTLRDLIMGKK